MNDDDLHDQQNEEATSQDEAFATPNEDPIQELQPEQI